MSSEEDIPVKDFLRLVVIVKMVVNMGWDGSIISLSEKIWPDLSVPFNSTEFLWTPDPGEGVGISRSGSWVSFYQPQINRSCNHLKTK